MRLFSGLLCFCIALCASFLLQAQQFNWVKGGGTNASLSFGAGISEATLFMCTDANKNVYALSRVNNAPVYADTFSGPTYGAYFNILITSYNCSGQMRWAKLITSSGGNCMAYGIVADSLGHIYLAGHMNTVVLHIGTDTAISSLLYDTEALIQLDTLGHFKWIRYIGDNTPSTFYGGWGKGAVGVDSSNNVHFFDGMNYGVNITPTITSHMGMYDLEYDPSGTLLSAKRLQLDSTLETIGVTIDRPTNKVYAYGYRYGTFCTCGATGGDSTAANFIAELDTARNQIWIDTIGTGYVTTGLFSGVVPDGEGHVYACGSGDGYMIYRGITYGPPPGATGGYIGFLMKLDTMGGLEWMNQCNAHYNVVYGAITLMPGNKIATEGKFVGAANIGTDTIVSPNNAPLFTVLDSSGTLISLQRVHGDGDYNFGYSIASDKVGNLYIGGSVSDTIPDTLIPSYHSIGGYTDFFILKYGVDCSCTAMPVADYSYTLSGPGTVNTTYTGTTAGIDSVVWHFGDGTTAHGFTASHTYAVVGNVDLCVTVYTSCGYDIKCKDILVNCSGAAVASFTDTGAAVHGFIYSGTVAGVDSVVWSFGDGHTATGLNPVHTYSASATYTVCARAYSACGNDTACGNVVINCTPVSSFTSGGSLPVNFHYTGTTAILDSVTWTFGDGGTATGTAPSHIYSISGTYTVCATAHTICGSNMACNTVMVSCAPLSAFTWSGSLPVNFTYSGSTTGIDSVTWDFGDGGTATGNTPAHTYAASGTYTVCATAHTACGNNTACNTVTVSCAPTAAFTNSGIVPVNFSYTGSTTGIDSVTWDFGDGHTATGTSQSHTYTAVGTYTVCATAYTACGSDDSCRTVTIPCISAPAAAFTDTGTHTFGFMYTGTTTGIDSVVWNFGDGNTATGNAPFHTFATADTYQVCVTAYNACGTDSVCHEVIRPPLGVASPGLSKGEVKVYPNPAMSELIITGITQSTAYRLLTITGVCVQRGMLHVGRNTLSIQDYAPGIYVLEMTTADGQKSMVRVVKE